MNTALEYVDALLDEQQIKPSVVEPKQSVDPELLALVDSLRNEMDKVTQFLEQHESFLV